MKTTVLTARVDKGLAQKIEALARLRRVDRQDVIVAGLHKELESAPEMSEVERQLLAQLTEAAQ